MDSVLNLLGLAYAARKTVLGEEVYNRIKNVKIIFIASDISEKSKERIDKKCFYYHIDSINCYSAEELSNAVGRNNVKLIGITDKGFSQSIKEKLK
ncbi:MAG: ribosomal L7Ae/L30e/S12e/Gadd45 family protein [Erysipelotrichaceae bacterium]|nr:ribosomal L7Ae/L30e/S12e/Gadd45 family protein [Erysipelotrichaceae bacterium]